MNEPVHYPSFLKAYPKVLGIKLTDIWWVMIAWFFLLFFQISQYYILFVILGLFIGKLIYQAVFQRNFIDLWLRSMNEMEWAHMIKFGGKY